MTIAHASTPPGAQVGARTAQELQAPGRAAEQLDRLHRHDAQREVAPLERERARVGAHASRRLPRGALAQRREQLGVEVERGHAVPAAGEVERHAPGARADVEDARRLR